MDFVSPRELAAQGSQRQHKQMQQEQSESWSRRDHSPEKQLGLLSLQTHFLLHIREVRNTSSWKDYKKDLPP